MQAIIGRAAECAVIEQTMAERRVVDLVLAARSNKEIATELHLSVRTVESHLASAYRKLGVRSRTELAVRRAGHP
jgi:DNA-binding NarL/FixJ family response regulator